MIIVVNKWDTIEKTTIPWNSGKMTFAINSIPFLCADCLCLCPDQTTLAISCQRWSNRSVKVKIRGSSAVLNDVIMDAIAINPTPTDKGKRLKIFYATQVATKPPTFVVFVNEEELMHSHTSVSWRTKFARPLFLKELQFIWLRENEVGNTRQMDQSGEGYFKW